jgi:peptidoglycan-associated lipoprotein
MKMSAKLIWTAMLMLALAACQTKPSTEGGTEGAGGGVTTGTAAGTGEVGGEALGGEERPVVTTVNFAFDSSEVDDHNRETVEANAAWLVAHPDVKVRLEGNCDERGTRDYNLALGERRAQAVKRMMVVLGVAQDRMQTVSYGEEKPLDPGHNEAAWARNRRVEIVYP